MVSEREVKMYMNGEAGEDPVTDNVSQTESKRYAFSPDFLTVY